MAQHQKEVHRAYTKGREIVMNYMQTEAEQHSAEIALLNHRICQMEKQEHEKDIAYERGKQSLLARYREQQKEALEAQKLQVTHAFQSGKKSARETKAQEVCFMLNRLHFKHREMKLKGELKNAEERIKQEAMEEARDEAFVQAAQVVQEENEDMVAELRAAKQIANTFALVQRYQVRRERERRERAERKRQEAESEAKKQKEQVFAVERAWAQEEHDGIVELSTQEERAEELKTAKRQIEQHQMTIRELKTGRDQLAPRSDHQLQRDVDDSRDSSNSQLAVELQRSTAELQELQGRRREAEAESGGDSAEVLKLREALRRQSMMMGTEQEKVHQLIHPCIYSHPLIHPSTHPPMHLLSSTHPPMHLLSSLIHPCIYSHHLSTHASTHPPIHPCIYLCSPRPLPPFCSGARN
jgi:hypothetical protein